jgi:cation transport ATPase
MPSEELKVPKAQSWALGIGLALCGLSGLVWLALDGVSFAGEAFFVAKAWLMAVHAALGAVLLLILGAFWPHLKAGLAQARNKSTGIFQLLLWGVVLASAWGLYYGPASIRLWMSRLHWVAACLLLVVVGLHVWLGRRSRWG